MVWVILQGPWWLKGCPQFTIYNDQKALSDLQYGKRDLGDFPEEVRNLSENTLNYNFTVKYVTVKVNTITDYFSHHTQWSKEGQPMAENASRVRRLMEEIVKKVETRIQQRHLDEPFIPEHTDRVSANDEYQTVLNHLKKGTELQDLKKLPTESPIHSYLSVCSRLGVINDAHESLMIYDHNCLVFSKKFQKRLMDNTHSAHLSMVRT